MLLNLSITLFFLYIQHFSGLPRFMIAFGVTALLIENLLYPMMGRMRRKPLGMVRVFSLILPLLQVTNANLGIEEE